MKIERDGVITLIIIMGTAFLGALRYFYYKGYYSFYNINIEFVNISNENMISTILIYFLFVITIGGGSFLLHKLWHKFLYNRNRRKINKKELNEESKLCIKESYKKEKLRDDSLLYLLCSFASFTILFMLNRPISGSMIVFFIFTILETVILQIILILVFIVSYKINQKDDNAQDENNEQYDIVDCCKKDEKLSKSKDLIIKLEKYKLRLCRSTKRNILIEIFLSFIILSFCTIYMFYSTGLSAAKTENEYKLTDNGNNVIINVSTTSYILLDANINGNKLIIDTSHQEIVSSIDLPYNIIEFEEVEVK